MTEPNIPALRKTLEHVKANPHEWQQGVWRCGTGMCFAGHAAILNGGRWLYPRNADDSTVVHPGTGELMHVQAFATEVLGLSNEQADDLFHHGNTLGDLEELIEEIAEEAS